MSNGNGWEGGSFDPDELGRMADRARGQAGSFFKRWGWWLLLLVALIALAVTGYYQVEQYEVAIVTRFGKYVRKAGPGPHFKWPFGIEEAHRVAVQRQKKEEFGFRTVEAGVRSEYAEDDTAASEATMLTGDLNVADVQWIIQYRIRDPEKYLFRVRNVRDTLRDMSEATMRQVVGDHSVTEVLTIGREAIQVKAKDALQELCNQYDTGIEVIQLVLQDVNPPKPVRASFNEVNEANQERERMINEAEARYNRVIPTARGKAQQTIQEAEGYATERVNQARGDVARFTALEAEYEKAPEVTRTRLYLETMADVLPAAQRRVVIDDSVKGMMPLMSLDGTSLPGRGRAAKAPATGGGDQ
jgi:membrane protease subunit HflK